MRYDRDRSRPYESVPFQIPAPATSSQTALCPDLLRLEDIGEADAWRGKVVRAFFRVLKVVTGV